VGRLWAASAGNLYLPQLYAGTRPADFAQYRAALTAAMWRPGYAKAFSLTTRTRHHDAEQALPTVKAPALIVMGDQDPDFPDPAIEARWITNTLHGELLMVPDAGHYPHSQRPDLGGPAVTTFAGDSTTTPPRRRPGNTTAPRVGHRQFPRQSATSDATELRCDSGSGCAADPFKAV